MKLLGPLDEARDKILSDIRRILTELQNVSSELPSSVEAGISKIRNLRSAVYEDINQIQHELLIIKSLEWLQADNKCPSGTVWHWNPRQTGGGHEPDLQGSYQGAVVASAEVTASERPIGVIDSRMRKTLEKLATLSGRKLYFVQSQSMYDRARTKVSKQAWPIEVVLIS